MKLTTILAAFAPLAMVRAGDSLSALYTHEGADCENNVVLVEYTFEHSCDNLCSTLEDNSDFMQSDKCGLQAPDSDEVFGSVPHVFIEFYEADSECDGDVVSSIAALTTGECYPALGYTVDKSTDNITGVMASVNEEGEVILAHFRDTTCEDKITNYNIVSTQGEKCLFKFMKAYLQNPSTSTSAPGSVGGEATIPSTTPSTSNTTTPTTAPATATTAPVSSSTAPSATTTAPVSSSTAPSATSSASTVAVSAIGLVAVAAAALF